MSKIGKTPVRLVRDGVVVQEIPSGNPCSHYVRPCPRPRSLGVDALFRSPPAHVLIDRYNPEYDEYFPEVDVSSDYFKFSHRDGEVWVFEYDRTETRKMRLR